jgi:DNA-binding transcriptional LysR family regulator
MDVRILKSFVAVCEAGNVTAAAARMHISQPALSRRLAELERVLGIELFEPDGRGIRPSRAALTILPLAQEAVDAHQRFHGLARILAGNTGGDLVIGATPQVIESMLANFIAESRRTHPDMHLTLFEAAGGEAANLILARRIDVGLTAAPESDSRLRSRRLGSLKLLAFGTAQSTLDGPFISLDRLCTEKLLTLHDRFQSRRIFESICRTNGLKPHIVFESSSTNALLAAAKAGLGIAVLPTSVATDVSGMMIVLDDRPLEFGLAAVWDSLGEKEALVLRMLDAFEPYVNAFLAAEK